MPDQQLTQEDSLSKYNEKWEVFMSNQREPYILNEMEYAVLQDALLKGMKGVIHFDSFMLNTSFIVSSYRKEHKLKPEYQPKQLEEPPYQEPTPEQIANRKKMIDDFRVKMGIKVASGTETP